MKHAWFLDIDFVCNMCDYVYTPKLFMLFEHELDTTKYANVLQNRPGMFFKNYTDRGILKTDNI